MFIKEIVLKGFRNFLDRTFDFNENKNLIYGPNGVGKTSILEAIYYLGFGKSFLTSKKNEISNESLSFFFISALVNSHNTSNQLQATLKENSFFFVNSQKSSFSDHIRLLYPLFFSSNTFISLLDQKLLFRKLIDRFICGVNDLYLHYILRYNKTLKQKNHLLKIGKYHFNEKELDCWNMVLAEMGSKIIQIRKGFVEIINKQNIMSFGIPLKMEYHHSLKGTDYFSHEDIYRCLVNNKTQEIKKGSSLVGPHRDHYNILVNKKRINLLSSGEKKKFLLLLYLSYIEIFKKKNNEYPILLIDDFDTAMDEENFQFINEQFPPMQILATSVNKKEIFDHIIYLKKEN